jgi:hypothetical protein
MGGLSITLAAVIGTRRSVRAVLAAAAVVGAVLVQLASPSVAASGSGSPASLGTGDDGTSITVHVGDTINVRLQPDGLFHFATPTSSDDTVLHRQGGGGGGRGHRHGHGHHHHKVTEGRTSFIAVAAGTAGLESFGSIACAHHRLCPAEVGGVAPIVARRWHVDVVVQ